MLAERTVRRLSIRAPADAIARRACFLIEDALRTATLPGAGAELLLLRRLRLPVFAPDASPQAVAKRLEAVCHAAIVVDGTQADDAALAAAPAVRFADALSAHLALTRLLLTDAARQAWCWPLLVKGYRPAFAQGAALRSLALSLATLPEAPTALPRWFALLLANSDTGCAALMLALQDGDDSRLQQACPAACKQAALAAPARWRSLLDWSAERFGVEDSRHRWLLGMAGVCAMDVERNVRWAPGDAEQGVAEARATRPAARRSAGNGGREKQTDVHVFPVGRPAPERGQGDSPVLAPAASARRAAAALAAGAPGDARCLPPCGDLPSAVRTLTAARQTSAPSQAAVPAASDALPALTTVVVADLPSTAAQRVAPLKVGAASAAGGLLFLVPLLNRLGLADSLSGKAATGDLPQRIFATLLRRLPIADEDPLWLLCGGALAVDREVAGEAAHWLRRCRSHLRRQVGIGLHSLVCRPASVAITATHVDVWQAIDAVDLRIRRAGLDVDPGWVAWLGRVLRFHYGRDCG